MALTFSDRDGWQFPPGLLGGRRIGLIKITGDDSYSAGGYAISPSDLSLKSEIEALIPFDDFSGQVPVWDVDNQKLKFYETGTTDAGLDETDADLSSVAGFFLYIGY